ncbi:hypothetical protein [Nocardiopsis sp. HUAS JQ3]|uniref:hypothetical protein n=1 Tax=Nocardiopsis sp. HUAS JQ3 TaxID=3061629 RepID=UPI0023A94D2B|nr:hypothetical protein [Nocardiopsis sp. HUAS JQ3]WDZ93341.1 hypothetical protein PV789_12750 [Nocardiopsis sp. HUAS JQ3]
MSGEPGSSAVVLTFAHQIADGVGGLRALLDLAAALGGEDLDRGGAPGTQEELLARTCRAAGGGEAAAGGEAADGVGVPEGGGAATGTPPEEDARMDAVGELVPFSGRLPHVDALALREGLTERLVRRCRLERTSVHAALCAAAATVLHREGREFVRVLSPMDLRHAVGLPDEVAVRFAGARTASTADEAKDFWALARRTGGSLARLRAPGALRAGAAAVVEHPPEGSGDAEAMMAAATAADIQITNVGVAGVAGGRGRRAPGRAEPGGPLRPVGSRADHTAAGRARAGRRHRGRAAADDGADPRPRRRAPSADGRCAGRGVRRADSRLSGRFRHQGRGPGERLRPGPGCGPGLRPVGSTRGLRLPFPGRQGSGQ